MSEYISFKRGREIEWLELNLLKTNNPISKALISDLAPGIEEEEIDSWLNEIKDRADKYKKPFYSVKSNRIIPLISWSEIPEYYLCVYYSFSGASDGTNGTKLFENISAQALKNFLNGEVYALGFPEGKGLNTFLNEISKMCNETRGLQANGSYKDDGVDVIGYKLFDDNRSANLYVLLQCAAGIHWKTKKKIELNRWTNYIIWYPESIISSISTVDYVSQKEWDKQASTFGMLLDRVRIYNSLYDKPVLDTLRNDVLYWCKSNM